MIVKRQKREDIKIIDFPEDVLKRIYYFLDEKEAEYNFSLTNRFFNRIANETKRTIGYKLRQLERALDETGLTLDCDKIYSRINIVNVEEKYQLLSGYYKVTSVYNAFHKEHRFSLDAFSLTTLASSEKKVIDRLSNIISDMKDQEAPLFFSLIARLNYFSGLPVSYPTLFENQDKGCYFGIINEVIEDNKTGRNKRKALLQLIKTWNIAIPIEEKDDYLLIKNILEKADINFHVSLRDEDMRTFILYFDWKKAFFYPKYVINSFNAFMRCVADPRGNAERINKILNKWTDNFYNVNISQRKLFSASNFFHLPWGKTIVEFLFGLPDELFDQHERFLTAAILNIFLLEADGTIFSCVKNFIGKKCERLIQIRSSDTPLDIKDENIEKILNEISEYISELVSRLKRGKKYPLYDHPKLLQEILNSDGTQFIRYGMRNKTTIYSHAQIEVLKNTKNICWDFTEFQTFVKESNTKKEWLLKISEIVTYWDAKATINFFNAKQKELIAILEKCKQTYLIFKRFKNHHLLIQLMESVTSINGLTLLKLLCRNDAEEICRWTLSDSKARSIAQVLKKINDNEKLLSLLYQIKDIGKFLKQNIQFHPQKYNTASEDNRIEIINDLNSIIGAYKKIVAGLGQMFKKTMEKQLLHALVVTPKEKREELVQKLIDVNKDADLLSYAKMHEEDINFFVKEENLTKTLQLVTVFQKQDVKAHLIKQLSPRFLYESFSQEQFNLLLDIDDSNILSWIVQVPNNVERIKKLLDVNLISTLKLFEEPIYDKQTRLVKKTNWIEQLIKKIDNDEILMQLQHESFNDYPSSFLGYISKLGMPLFFKIYDRAKKNQEVNLIQNLKTHYTEKWVSLIIENNINSRCRDDVIASFPLDFIGRLYTTTTQYTTQYETNCLKFLFENITVHANIWFLTKNTDTYLDVLTIYLNYFAKSKNFEYHAASRIETNFFKLLCQYTEIPKSADVPRFMTPSTHSGILQQARKVDQAKLIVLLETLKTELRNEDNGQRLLDLLQKEEREFEYLLIDHKDIISFIQYREEKKSLSMSGADKRKSPAFFKAPKEKQEEKGLQIKEPSVSTHDNMQTTHVVVRNNAMD